jgi:F0F1-type ATP synthase membrane subunit c/vacuolar-type H+-ATPase subunit K
MSMQKKILYSTIAAFWVALVAGFVGVKMGFVLGIFAASFIGSMVYLNTPTKA